ncbi:acetate/propionate family kinase [candidate division KSB1 bacterium]|nr:acetate/propionate family kinase [candidate division KSB1 bacterium]
MKILIANPGSTSYKCKLLSVPEYETVFQATVERIGDANGIYTWQWGNETSNRNELHITDYNAAVSLTLHSLQERIAIEGLSAIGFKVVLARYITGCVELSDIVLDAMKTYQPLAPVHTDAYLTAIHAFAQVMPDIPRIGLFETAFHSEIPPEAYLYGIPYEMYEKYGIRKYGFHGASHRYVAEYIQNHYAADMDDVRIISCHLGGSSSVCAIRNGASVDTSMGMSPQCGLLNAKRVGDLDPFALLYLMEQEQLTIDATRELLNTRGGVLGISGISGDVRDVESAMKKGHEQALYAFKAFAYAVKRYIGEYLAVLNGTDYIVFTAGIGQRSPVMRAEILKDMDQLGIILDGLRNDSVDNEGLISTDDSPVKLIVIPTNEELVVARAVAGYLNRVRNSKHLD